MRRLAAISCLALVTACAQLQYPVHTPMVTVADEAPPPPMLAPPPRAPRRSTALSRHWRGVTIGAGVLTLAGGALLAAGAIGYMRQAAASAAAEAKCNGDAFAFLCGLDVLSTLPYVAVIFTGTMTTVSGLVLFGLGYSGHDDATR